MVTERKLNILFAFPSYGGNGGISSEVPEIRKWFARTLMKCKDDPRIGEVHEITLSDTPITMVRNRFVKHCRDVKCDVLIMVDSDMHPDLHLNEEGVKPFFESSFDFLYDHWSKGPCCIAAPYCGPPGAIGSENMYVFEWHAWGDHGDESMFSLEQVSRPMAARMRGIHPAAALPTGMIMYDIRCFELIEPSGKSKDEVLEDLITGKISKREALNQLHDGWFYYEWSDKFAHDKASTEDVTNTRDISMAGSVKLKYNPVYCNWDSPVGHWKPWCVRGRPMVHDATKVAETLRRACESAVQGDEVIVDAASLLRNARSMPADTARSV